MISSKTQKWIEAGKLIAENPDAKILCPECEQNNLEVKDIRNDNNVSELERIMYCSNCGARNILRLKR
ncbi:hypothetical protein [Lutispora saccharofermentans]|uniref:Uncharacterized protein n=1 Tax=Lutispora saccharofermentans TaxID=3024236 RepID=A0ABT1NC29_9FIRM|nr:hypothetical protein [Lutispora saccharofermentans]MCQ1528818.1 hypothetical protein [Lutispora saccharofermentans]